MTAEFANELVVIGLSSVFWLRLSMDLPVVLLLAAAAAADPRSFPLTFGCRQSAKNETDFLFTKPEMIIFFLFFP